MRKKGQKLSDHDKALIIADYNTGKYSQRDLAGKYNLALTTINKILNKTPPQYEHLVDAQVSLLCAKAYLTREELNAIIAAANDIVFNQGLVTNATQLNLVRLTKLLEKNTKQERDGDNIIEMELSPNDYRNIQEAIDKAAITLGVAERHAPKTAVSVENSIVDNKLEVEFIRNEN